MATPRLGTAVSLPLSISWLKTACLLAPQLESHRQGGACGSLRDSCPLRPEEASHLRGLPSQGPGGLTREEGILHTGI